MTSKDSMNSSYSDDPNDPDYKIRSSSSDSSSQDVGDDGGTSKELYQEASMVAKEVFIESGNNDYNGGDNKDHKVVGKGSTEAIVENNIEEYDASRCGGDGSNGDGDGRRPDVLDSSVDSSENVLSNESIFGSNFDTERCKESFVRNVNVIVKPSDNDNSGVWTDYRLLKLYHAFIALDKVLELEEGKVYAQGYRLKSTQKTSNIRINKRVKEFKKEPFFEGLSYNDLMKIHFIPKFRLFKNENVEDEQNVMDKYHIYKVKKEEFKKYKKHYVKGSMEDMAGRFYSIDQMFYVLMDEFVEMNRTQDKNDYAGDWVKVEWFQNHVSQKYPNITKQVAKIFYESLVDGETVVEDNIPRGSEHVGTELMADLKSTKVEIHEKENVAEKSFADFYLTCGILYKGTGSGTVEYKYIYMCDINTLKSSASLVESLEVDDICFSIAEMIVRDFGGYGGTVLIEDDGQVFLESKHDIKDVGDEKNYACKVYQRQVPGDFPTKYLQRYHVDGSEAASEVSWYNMICFISRVLYSCLISLRNLLVLRRGLFNG